MVDHCLLLSSSSAAADRLSVHPEWGQVFGEGLSALGRLSCHGSVSENRLQPQNRHPHQDRRILQDRCQTIHPGQQQQPSAQERCSHGVHTLHTKPECGRLRLAHDPVHPTGVGWGFGQGSVQFFHTKLGKEGLLLALELSVCSPNCCHQCP